VAGEFALVAVDRDRIEHLTEQGDRRAAGVLKSLRRLSFELSGAQLGITWSSLLVGFLIEPSIGRPIAALLERAGLPETSALGVAVTVALILATATQMVVGELVPKNLAIARPVGMARAIATPMRGANLLFKPLIVFLNASANWTVRRLGIEPRDELTAVHSLEELEVLIRSSKEGGGLKEEEFSLLARSITFGDKTCADALTPRVSMETIGRDQTLDALSDAALESGHSRFPVCGEGIDDIVGVAHVKDTYAIPRAERKHTPVTQIMRPALVVPESRDLATLLVEMRRDRHQLVVVVDEYGGTAGIVTIEDLVEEIVGEIEDEYDPREQAPRLTGPPSGVHVVPGTMHGAELEETTGFELPEGDFETLAGLLLGLFDRIPEKGDHVSYEGWEFKVVEMDRNRIDKVLVVAPPTTDTQEDQAR
jgi:CBS domain containing-hemolysin-like protein